MSCVSFHCWSKALIITLSTTYCMFIHFYDLEMNLKTRVSPHQQLTHSICMSVLTTYCRTASALLPVQLVPLFYLFPVTLLVKIFKLSTEKSAFVSQLIVGLQTTGWHTSQTGIQCVTMPWRVSSLWPRAVVKLSSNSMTKGAVRSCLRPRLSELSVQQWTSITRSPVR